MIGAIVGTLLGYTLAVTIAGGSYRYLGGMEWEVIREPWHFLPSRLLEITLALSGSVAGLWLEFALRSN